jgi:hypothetical protein
MIQKLRRPTVAESGCCVAEARSRQGQSVGAELRYPGCCASCGCQRQGERSGSRRTIDREPTLHMDRKLYYIKLHRFNRHSALCRSEDNKLITKPYWFPALGRDLRRCEQKRGQRREAKSNYPNERNMRHVADVPKPQRNWTTSQKNDFLHFPLQGCVVTLDSSMFRICHGVTQRHRAPKTAEKQTLSSQLRTAFLVRSFDGHVTRWI